MFRFLTAGESHGQSLNIIIDGVPSGFPIDIDFINAELAKRQVGYGRGGRMKIETDKAIIKSGVRQGKTTGAPIAIEIINKDFENSIKNSIIITVKNMNRRFISFRILAGLTSIISPFM